MISTTIYMKCCFANVKSDIFANTAILYYTLQIPNCTNGSFKTILFKSENKFKDK